MYAGEYFELVLPISKMINDYINEFTKVKHFPPTDIVEELCHFVYVWGCVVVSLDIFDSVGLKKGAIK